MKVLDLRCTHDHTFEGWFASEDDFNDQLARRLIACPICGDNAVTRIVSAPRLNLSSAKAPEAVDKGTPEQARQRMQALWLRALRKAISSSEDVGERFAEEARRIHYDEAPQRNIRGVASREDVVELIDEGIEIMPLPVPADFKGTLQ